MGAEFGFMSIIFKEENHKYSPSQIINIYQHDSSMCTVYINLSTNICEFIWPYLAYKRFLVGRKYFCINRKNRLFSLMVKCVQLKRKYLSCIMIFSSVSFFSVYLYVVTSKNSKNMYYVPSQGPHEGHYMTEYHSKLCDFIKRF